MKNHKALLIVSVILIAIGLAGIISLGLITGSFNQRQALRFNQFIMSDVDRHFIEQMIPHHEDAVAMAEMALTKAEHEELKKLAENIINDQTREIDNMRLWYKSWYGTDVSDPVVRMGGMGRGMMADNTDLKSLENAELFDKEFIEQMIPHHQMAIMMASMMLNRTDRVEMKKLAQDIIRTQTEEINQMSAWYSEWY